MKSRTTNDMAPLSPRALDAESRELARAARCAEGPPDRARERGLGLLVRTLGRVSRDSGSGVSDAGEGFG